MQLTSTAAKLFRPNVSANTLSQATLAILRVTLGVMMVHNGLDKLADIENFARAYVEYLGLPFPIFLSYVAAYTELIGAPPVGDGLVHSVCLAGFVWHDVCCDVSPHFGRWFEPALPGAFSDLRGLLLLLLDQRCRTVLL